MPLNTESITPLFDLFWENSCLNRTQAIPLSERIGNDAAQAYTPARPRYAQAATPLPDTQYPQTRLSTREFATTPINTQQLSELFAPFASHAQGTRRNLASAGAKYPIWVYAHLLNTEHIDQGYTVWYDPDIHGFTRIGPCPNWTSLQTSLGINDWETTPSVVIGICADTNAMTQKYGERGGRFVLLEAGMYIGALYQQCSHLDLGGVALGSYHDESCLEQFGLTYPSKLMSIFVCGHIPNTKYTLK